MATIINPMTTTAQTDPVTGLSNLHVTAQNYCDKRLLAKAMEKLVYYANVPIKRPLPKNNGKTIEMWKYNPLEAVTSALTEAVVPTAQTYTQAKITADVAQYGAYIAVSDWLDMTAITYDHQHLVDLNADQMALSLDTLVRNVLIAGSQVIRSGGRAAKNLITATDILEVDDIRKAVRILEKKKAPKFMRGGKGYYKCIVGPDAKFALQSDDKWIDVATYQQAEKIENGEIGKLYGVIFIESTNVKVDAGAGVVVSPAETSTVDVDNVVVFGDESFAVIDLGAAGSNAHIITKGFGSAGTADPLDQVATFGWKINGMVAKILNGDWIVRIESAVA